MIAYPNFNFSHPILPQLPKPYRSFAVLPHPFIEMDARWVSVHKDAEFPTDEDILQYGRPVTWQEICTLCNFSSLRDLLLALQTFIGSLATAYERKDLADQLTRNLPDYIFIPNSDLTSPFLWERFLQLLEKEKCQSLAIQDPFQMRSYTFSFDLISIPMLSQISPFSISVSDTNNQFAFVSDMDSFLTYFMCGSPTIQQYIDYLEIEAVVYDETKTYPFG